MDPSQGDLHFAPDNQGAAPVSKVCNSQSSCTSLMQGLQIFPMLFPPPLLEAMKPGSEQNTITLLACGGIVKCTQSFNDLKTFLNG